MTQSTLADIRKPTFYVIAIFCRWLVGALSGRQPVLSTHIKEGTSFMGVLTCPT